MVNEPSVDALSITLAVSAFVEMDTPTTRQKTMMDDLEMNAAVTFWSSSGHHSDFDYDLFKGLNQPLLQASLQNMSLISSDPVYLDRVFSLQPVSE